MEADLRLLPVRVDLDPMYAPHVAELFGLKRPLLLIVGPKPNEYLGQRARAEMAASLACVRWVVSEDVTFPGQLDLREEEAGWVDELEGVVRAKSELAKAGTK